MARLDLRCAANVPVRFSTTDIGGATYDAFTRDVGLFGTFVSSGMNLPQDFHVDLEMQLPSGFLKVRGRVLRRDDNGIAVKFTGLDGDSRQHLWDFLHGRIGENTKSCPFCNVQVPYRAERCPECGMFIDFRHEGYMDIYKDNLLSIRSTELGEAVEKFRREMDEIERLFASREENEGDLVREVTAAMHKICGVCRNLEDVAGVRSDLVKSKQEWFRREADPYFSQSHFINHAITWPRGYPGDYEVLEGLYRNMPLSSGIGYLLDLFFLNTTLAVAVKERLTTLREMLRRELMMRSRPRVLDIACGSCREVFETAPEIGSSGAEFTCIDFDSDSLSFSSDRLSYTNVLNQIIFRKYNAIRMTNHERNVKEFDYQDIIYSTGLFDYLTNHILVRMIRALYKLTNPGGKIISSFKDCNRYRSQLYHWVTEWDAFYQRTEKDCMRLFEEAGIPDRELMMLRERSGVIVFFVIAKR
jgi:extracellular factor (EF) 3-hydroxypalmitic acid methyl ester biosynthesis protein